MLSVKERGGFSFDNVLRNEHLESKYVGGSIVGTRGCRSGVKFSSLLWLGCRSAVFDSLCAWSYLCLTASRCAHHLSWCSFWMFAP